MIDEFFTLKKVRKPFPPYIYRGKKQKSSIFRGVRKDAEQSDLWFAQLQAAGLHRRCATEAEAAAVYRAVAKAYWGKVPGECAKNRLCKVYHKIDEQTVLMAVGRQHCCLVDADRYKEFLGDWFVHPKTGSVTAICYAEQVEGRWEFTFLKMEEAVFGGRCYHINDQPLDNRRENLIRSRPKENGLFGNYFPKSQATRPVKLDDLLGYHPKYFSPSVCDSSSREKMHTKFWKDTPFF